MKFKRIHVIVNPAAGRSRPVLKILNTVFQNRNLEWEIFVTKAAGDVEHFARRAVEEGVAASITVPSPPLFIRPHSSVRPSLSSIPSALRQDFDPADAPGRPRPTRHPP